VNQITEAPTKPRHIECTMADYHARAELSNSQCGDYIKHGPLYFYGMHVAKPPLYARQEKAVFAFGTATHQLFSSPGSIGDVAIVIPEEKLSKARAKHGKAYKEWTEEHPGLIYLKAEEMHTARIMVRRVHEHPVASKLFSSALHHEHTLIWTDNETGLALRTRPDLASGFKGAMILSDFKTTRALSPREFARDAKKFGYHRQGAWYSEPVKLQGYEVRAFYFITSDKSPANECRVYDLDDEDYALGLEEIRRARGEIVERLGKTEALGEDAWRSDLDRIAVTISLPKWDNDDWRIE
jgi:hypothetical protein